MPNAATRLLRYSAEEKAAQAEQAFILFAKRKSLNEIGDALGITPQTAGKRVQEGIRISQQVDRTEAVQKDLRLIDHAIAELVELLGHHDADITIKASNALMTALKRRSMLLGLDAPTQVVVAGQIEVKATIDPRILEARELLRVEATRADQPALPAAQS